MFLAESLTEFYPDLLDARFVSRFAIYHQRYSTNTFPTWRLAQPFRMLAHNGEINTLHGNANWMKSHETRLSHVLLDPFIEDIKPIVQAGGSDTATLDNVFELLVRGGRDAPMAKAMLIPESTGNNATMPENAPRAVHVLQRGDGTLGRAGRDRRDRRALGDRGPRPQRAAPDALHRHRRRAADRRLRDRHGEGRRGPHRPEGPRRSRPVHRRRSRGSALLRGRRAEGHARRPQALRQVDRAHHAHRRDRQGRGGRARPFAGEELRRRQLAMGYTLEELEGILHPMVEDANEAVGSMGDDTPIAVLSSQYRGLHHYFRQTFSQVTNPPIDSLRETRVMTLRTRWAISGTSSTRTRRSATC
jgi:glutamate synthase (NADPH) large chain